MNTPVVKPPRAEKRPRVETWHGYEKRDDYHWLKAANWQEVMHDPSVLPQDIRAFLEGENAYHEAVMAGTKGLQETLFAEMKGRIKEDDSSVPAPDGAWAYYVRNDLMSIAMQKAFAISLTALAGGILNTYSRFAVPAVTPKPRCSVTVAIAGMTISGSLTGTCTACSSAVSGPPL